MSTGTAFPVSFETLNVYRGNVIRDDTLHRPVLLTSSIIVESRQVASDLAFPSSCKNIQRSSVTTSFKFARVPDWVRCAYGERLISTDQTKTSCDR